VYRMWRSPGALHFLALAPECSAFQTFAHKTRPLMDMLHPVMALGAKLHAQNERSQLQQRARADIGCTRAETEAVELLARGLTNKEIAMILGRSHNTVRNQIASCFKKLGVTTRAEATFMLAHVPENTQR
jgi:DNA-binding CsgD family transcriptional regulator